ncbi:uncharacterized protein LOC123321039 [Coccinella septempunctata]|uniref:uncharacterized protein LOC123321039 n=1 Tax=Coccinella septempunctata TaxID=41139 RepID=UPI001D064784|nr:uncharacterized protein LOC123321039 [Coccinella septempunctata]
MTTNDCKRVNEILGSVLSSFPTLDPSVIKRLGRRSGGNVKPRPIKFIMSSSQLVYKVLGKSRVFKESFDVFISSDRTPRQRDYFNKIKGELEQRRFQQEVYIDNYFFLDDSSKLFPVSDCIVEDLLGSLMFEIDEYFEFNDVVVGGYIRKPEVMENDSTNVSPIEFVRNVRYYWSVETMADFLENKLPHLDFHVDTLDYEGKTVLQLLVGCETRHNSREKSMMCLLLKHGASPLKKPRYGGTIIESILQNEDSALIIEFLKYVENINMILDKKTALHIATRRKLKDVVEYIVDRNADVNKRAWTGCTPLHESVRSKSVEMMKILESGADMEIKNKIVQIPLHLAVE